MRRRRLIELLVARWGFAATVAVAIGVGLAPAVTVAPPADIPGVALQAVAVYRVEVGAAVFCALYLITLALVLAMHNRGFTEIGSGGIKAQGLSDLSQDELAIRDILTELSDEVDNLEPDWRSSMAGRRRPDPPEVVKARKERIRRLLAELSESVERRRTIVNRLRAEEGLPPLESRRRV